MGRTLARLPRTPDVEVVVADGGSRDRTVEIALNSGVRVVRCPRGKALQMNRGASEASGRTLLFLHADTLPPVGFEHMIRSTAARPGVVAGAFRLRIEARGARFRAVEFMTNLRSTLMRMPYGDQGIFLRAETFRRLGGFPVQALMEDFELARRLKREGRVVTLPAQVRTSARRWLRLGVFRTTLLNQRIILAYLLGADPALLARWYRG